MSDSHPCIRILNKASADTVAVYNDSLTETLSARRLPCRSLFFEYANNILDRFDKDGWKATDISFNTSFSMCHYRRPILYATMLEVIAGLVRRESAKCDGIGFVIYCK
mgnify:CR=1 FL=1